jgi:Zn-dependent oligopeptidase
MQAKVAFSAISKLLSFDQNLLPDKALCNASNKADVRVSTYGVELSICKDIYDAKVAAKVNIDASGKYVRLDREQCWLINKVFMDNHCVGLVLPKAECVELAALCKDLSAACLEFSMVNCLSCTMMQH